MTTKILPLTIRRPDAILRGARYVLRFGEHVRHRHDDRGDA
jgi:hypothetical protein